MTTRSARTPTHLAAALKQNSRAADAFRNLSPSHKRQYIHWIVEAKQAQTRQRRIEQTIQRVTAHKPRNSQQIKRGR
jgi:uncharacterized protein YdeI (YjbR/CyaY-like superfamily)